LSRALAATACLAFVVAGAVGCASATKTPAAAPTTSTSPGPTAITSTTAVVEAGCRAETAPTGTDNYGVGHTGERICTWGPELRSHVNANGFVDNGQNHPVDLAVAARCWSTDGRFYLRTPAVNGWACIGGHGGTAPVAASQTCAQNAAANHYIDIQAVSPGDAQSFTISYETATLVCGGADDSHFDTSGPVLQRTVPASIPLGILENGPTNIVERQTTAAELPGAFAHLLYGHLFLIENDSTGTISGLQQQYHP
jgi:hypothetical protein